MLRGRASCGLWASSRATLPPPPAFSFSYCDSFTSSLVGPCFLFMELTPCLRYPQLMTFRVFVVCGIPDLAFSVSFYSLNFVLLLYTSIVLFFIFTRIDGAGLRKPAVCSTMVDIHQFSSLPGLLLIFFFSSRIFSSISARLVVQCCPPQGSPSFRYQPLEVRSHTSAGDRHRRYCRHRRCCSSPSPPLLAVFD